MMPRLNIVSVRAVAEKFTLAEILDVLGEDKGNMGTGSVETKREGGEKEVDDGKTEEEAEERETKS